MSKKYQDGRLIKIDVATGKPIAKAWVVLVSGMNKTRRFVNVIDIFDDKGEATKYAASVRNDTYYKRIRYRNQLKVHVRPNWDLEDNE